MQDPHTFTARRFTRGNWLFPAQLIVTYKNISFRQRRLTGVQTHTFTISMLQVMRTRCTGRLCSLELKDANPKIIKVHGLRKQDTHRIEQHVHRRRSLMGAAIIGFD